VLVNARLPYEVLEALQQKRAVTTPPPAVQ